MIYVKIDFRNYKELATPGRKLIYGQKIGMIEANPQWSDGIHVHGRSVKNILEEFDDVCVLGA